MREIIGGGRRARERGEGGGEGERGEREGSKSPFFLRNNVSTCTNTPSSTFNSLYEQNKKI